MAAKQFKKAVGLRFAVIFKLFDKVLKISLKPLHFAPAVSSDSWHKQQVRQCRKAENSILMLFSGVKFLISHKNHLPIRHYFTALNAASSAAIKSAAFSIPIESLIVFGFIPCSSSCSSVSCECVVLAG